MKYYDFKDTAKEQNDLVTEFEKKFGKLLFQIDDLYKDGDVPKLEYEIWHVEEGFYIGSMVNLPKTCSFEEIFEIIVADINKKNFAFFTEYAKVLFNGSEVVESLDKLIKNISGILKV